MKPTLKEVLLCRATSKLTMDTFIHKMVYLEFLGVRTKFDGMTSDFVIQMLLFLVISQCV